MSDVPQACTLPTAEQPLRVAEFDRLLAHALLRWQRVSPTRLRLLLAPLSAPAAQDLARRESSCCSFFTFTFSAVPDALVLHVDVPPEHVAVLDALAGRAAAVVAA